MQAERRGNIQVETDIYTESKEHKKLTKVAENVFLCQSTCRKYGLDRKTPEMSGAISDLGLVSEEWSFLKRINWVYIYWSRAHSLTWCKVPKAGSSTWTFNFLKLAGVKDPKSKIHKALRDHYPKQSSNSIMKDTYRYVKIYFCTQTLTRIKITLRIFIVFHFPRHIVSKCFQIHGGTTSV